MSRFMEWCVTPTKKLSRCRLSGNHPFGRKDEAPRDLD